ncbi:MAG: hypothetical protein FXV80_05765 [Candidatus Thioglobus sp.]|nr:MAG: hypothetical protein FXV80_05765 [Candidatus Thioglobus sp.]
MPQCKQKCGRGLGGALGLGSAADAKVIHVWTKAADITWHAAWANSEAGVAGITGSGNKFSPLGVSILATAPGVNGNVAIGNFGNAGQEDEVYGIRADTKLAGMGVQFAVGNLILGKGATFDGKDAANDTFVDLIVTRKLGSGSNIKFSAGKYNNTRSFGTTVSVKF